MIQIQKQTWAQRNLYLILADGGSVQLDIYRRPQGEHGIVAFIHNLWVQPFCRRKGTARQLLDKAENIVRNLGLDALYLEWEEADTPRWMLEHYIRRGYSEVAFGDGLALLKKPLTNKPQNNDC